MRKKVERAIDAQAPEDRGPSVLSKGESTFPPVCRSMRGDEGHSRGG